MFNNLYVPGVNMFPSQQQRQVQYPQPMQPMPNYQQQNMMQSQYNTPTMPAVLKGRTVGSFDEVKAAQIDLDGTFTYFICPADNCIYAKAINMNGLPIVQTYRLSKENPDVPKRYADADTVEALQQKVESLERYLKGEKDNESNAINTDDRANTKQSEPNGNLPANVW